MQLLNADGTLTEGKTFDQYAERIEGLSEDLLLSMYEHMVTMRTLDLQLEALQRQGQLAMWVPSLGQEAAQIGSAMAMRTQDWLFPSYREHVMTRIRGVDFRDLVNMFRGNSHGAWDWQSTHCHQYTLVIGSQALHATGFAMAKDRDGLVGTGDSDVDTAVIGCFGDGATSEGDVSESFVFAASTNAPIVFLCQNNGWAISVPTSTQAKAPIATRAAGFGLRTNRIDGNDILISYFAMQDQLDAARSGKGPGLVEAMTYRRGAHTTSDDPTKYRSKADEAAWDAKDPLPRFRGFLRNRGVSEAVFDATQATADDAAADVRGWISTLPEPVPADMFKHVYSEPQPLLEAEAAWLADYEQQMGGE